jgi:PAS domain S-box-containing protein
MRESSQYTVINLDRGNPIRPAGADLLRQAGYRVLEAGDENEVLSLAEQERPALVLLHAPSDDQFRLLADNAPALMWMNGPDGCEFVNREYLRFLGVGDTGIRGYEWAQFIHPDDRHQYVTAYLEAFRHRRLFEATFRFRRHDGEYRWMKSVGTPRFGPQGELLGYVGSTVDITDVRRAPERPPNARPVAATHTDESLRYSIIGRRSMLRRYGVAALCVTVALLVRWLLDPILQDRTPLATISGAVIVAVWYGGWGPGLAAVLIGYLGANWLFIEPRFAFGIDTATIVSFSTYLTSNLFIIALGEAMRRAQRRAHANAEVAIERRHRVETEVAERRKSERALRESEAGTRRALAELQAIYDQSPIGMLQLDSELRYVRINKVLAAMNGVPAADHIGKTVREVVPNLAPLVESDFRRVMASGQPVIDIELAGETGADPGVTHTWLESWYPQRDETGRVVGLNVVAQDITERKRTEIALKEAQHRLELALEASNAATWGWDIRENRLDEWTPEYRELYGFTPDEPPHAATWWARLHPDDATRVNARIQEILETPGDDVWNEEFRIVHPLMGERWIGGVGRCFRDETGRAVRMTGVNIDVTGRKRAHEALRQNEERYRSLVSVITDVPWTTDAAGCFVQAQGNWQTYTGQTWEEYKGFGWVNALHPDDRERVRESWRRACGSRTRYETEGRIWHAPTQRWRDFTAKAIPLIEADGSVREWVGSCTDITDRKQIEQELLKSSKLESIGVLAGGIAHDFNNLLTAIVGNLYLSKSSVTPGDKLYARLEEAEKACMRARGLTQQLLTFARGGAPILRTFAIADPLKEWVTFALRGSNVQPRVETTPDLWSVDADEGQLNQVVSNVVINALQAMPEGGTVTVRAENLRLDPDPSLPLAPGPYVRITVVDQGVGIPKDLLSKVFDPFFTTKSRGSGLGLTTSYAIIAKHKGHLTIESEPGRGTTVSIYLPASAKGVPSQRSEIDVGLRGQGSVLFMDDEEALRGVIGELLRQAGYQVDCVADGAEAIERYRKAMDTGHPFDLVILDLTVPGGMGGRETIERLLALDPDVNAVVSSGYSNDPVMAQFQKYGFRGRLAKPYEVSTLGKTLLQMKEAKKEGREENE